MKLHGNDVNVIDNENTQSTAKFQITANGTAFQILSSGLYSDKVTAVIRELTCNAYDSHVAAGKKEKPVKVTLPTDKNPEFKVKDYGTGLNHDEVISLYTNYFSSNKRDDNTQIGGFGLGSKSPFAYTDSFTVCSIKDGIKRIYTAYLTDGAPAITKLLEEDSTDESGIEVSMLVKNKDIEEFHKKANLLQTWFDTKPELINLIPNLSKYVRSYEYSGNYLYLTSNKHTAISKYEVEGTYAYGQAFKKPYVIMGNVCYPLDVNAVVQGNEMLSDFLNLGVELRIPIGSVNVAASREQLQYDPASLKFLQSTLIDEINDFKTFLSSKNDKTWKGAVDSFTFCNSVKNSRELHKFISSHANDLLDLYTSEHMNLTSKADNTTAVNVGWYPKDVAAKKIVMSGLYSRVNDKYPCKISKHADTAIFIGDIPGVSSLIPLFRKRNSSMNQCCIIYISASKSKLPEAINTANMISKEMLGLPIVLASTFKDELAKKGVNPTITVKTYSFVEIDNRKVSVVDSLTGVQTSECLSDVTEQYYIVNDTKNTKNGGVYLNNPNISDDGINYSDVLHLSAFLKELKPTVKNWTFPKSYIRVNPVELKNLKLVERGWKPYLIECYSIIKNLPEYEVIRDSYPEMVFNQSLNQYYAPFGWITLLSIYHSRMNGTLLNNFENVLKKEDWLKHVIGFEKALQPRTNTQSLRFLANNMQNCLSKLDKKGVLKLKHEQHYNEELAKAYPKLEYIELKKLYVDLFSTKSNSNVVFQLLIDALT